MKLGASWIKKELLLATEHWVLHLLFKPARRSRRQKRQRRARAAATLRSTAAKFTLLTVMI